MKLFSLLACGIILIGATVTSCGTNRTAATQPMDSVKPVTEWHDVYMPVKVSVQQPLSVSFTGRATMVNDSLINISMRVLGMEIAVVNITSDSIFVIDKYHKLYFSEATSTALGGRDITVSDMQNMLMGIDPENPFAPSIYEEGVTFGSGSKAVTIKYADFVRTPAGQAASQIVVDAVAGGRNVKATLQWQFDKAEWNTGRNARVSMPRGYKRVTPADVVSTLGKM